MAEIPLKKLLLTLKFLQKVIANKVWLQLFLKKVAAMAEIPKKVIAMGEIRR
jgi:hypothetical protein